MKNCPFCGYNGIDHQISKDKVVFLYCGRCGAEGPPTPIGGGIDKKKAISIATLEWNERKI